MTDELTADLLSWDQVAEQENWSGLLLGNGFSQNIWPQFGYSSLYERASQAGDAQLSVEDIALFTAFETTNFEAVLSALLISNTVATTLHQDTHLFAERIESIRKALIRAVHSVHIPWAFVEDATLGTIASSMESFNNVYSTNYDFLPYWALMTRPKSFRDFFWASEFNISNTEIWGNQTRIHFLHGGLHLYRRPNGKTLKRFASESNNLLDLFGLPFKDALPLFVSEGSHQDKLSAIYRSDYLSFVFSRFSEDEEPLVVFGHSLGESDKHIVDIVASTSDRPIAVSLRASSNVKQRKAGIIEALPDAKLYFFDAATHPLGKPELAIHETND